MDRGLLDSNENLKTFKRNNVINNDRGPIT